MIPRIIQRLVGSFTPQAYKDWVEKNLTYADISMSFENFIGLAYLYSLAFQIVSIIIYIVFLSATLLPVFLVSAAVFAISFALFHLFIVMIADSRSKAAEEVLPDMLRLMALNLKSGMTSDRALLLAARPEFGIMENEIKGVARKVISGIPIEVALQDLIGKIKSKILERTMRLITEGLKKGGQLAILLEQIAEDIVRIKSLRKEIAAQVSMYAIFIFFSVGIGAPLLYSVSTTLVETMTKITSVINPQEFPVTEQLGVVQFTKIDVDITFLIIYQVVALVLTSVFGGLLIGLLRDGSEKSGIKVIPVLLLISFTILFITRFLLHKLIIL